MKRSLEPTIQTLLTYGVNLRIGTRLARAYYMAERNSKQRGIPFELTIIQLAKLAQRARGKCELTSLPFEIVDTSRKWDRQPWTASIDRIDCSQGYTYENCRLVCAAVNVALNSWGAEVLERIAEAVVIRRAKRQDGYLLNLHNKTRRKTRKQRQHLGNEVFSRNEII